MMHFVFFLAASAACPALTTPTVAGVLGEVETSVMETKKPVGYVCQFAGPGHDLHVSVLALDPVEFLAFEKSSCDGGRVEALKAIGNEAVACSFASKREIVAKVVGRVRNKAFSVVLSSTDGALDEKAARGKVAMLAEQVAGNLF
jgi:hypothetical protein